ncbi:MAG TPA: TIGR03118 family protein [Pyrinomonadaceae bacterium]|nr:TIGR03118 family protein [Pyrinomonadaceae bacterium]
MLSQRIAKYRQFRILFVFALVALCGAVTLLGFQATAKGPVRTKSSKAQQFPNANPNAYRPTILASDIPGVGQTLDPSLVNPWGIAQSATSPFWVSNNGTGTATLYGGDVNGSPFTKNTLTVTIPGGSNTGAVFNGSSSFVITDSNGTGPARFIFDTEAGTIAAWRSGTTAVTTVTTANAVYKGLGIGAVGASSFLYAANFRNGTVDVFGTSFTPVGFGPGTFVDPAIPAGYAPFNIQNLGGKIYVTYALQDVNKHDDVPGAGHGYVDVYDPIGTLQGRLISGGVLNSPWGVTIAPASFGLFANALLVGNFGDGRINAFDRNSGVFLGTLNDQGGNPLAIEGLWGLTFGNGVGGGDVNNLYFSAGIGGESHGVFGSIVSAAPAPALVALSSATYSVSEGAGFIDVAVNRSGDTSQAATVNFATYAQNGAGRASPTSDFVPTLGTLRFAPGQVSSTFRVLIVDDVYVEGDETFNVILSNPTGLGLTVPNTAVVTINDNDSVSAVVPNPSTFVASLDGPHEVPPKVTNGAGTGIVIVTNEATGAAKVSLAFSGLTSGTTAAHIHGPAAPGVNAPVLFPLPIATGVTSGGVNDFSITLSPTQIQNLKDGLLYFNVHTTNNPGGEIRGQIFSNPIDESGYFVREQYLDFLNRQPDASGQTFWQGKIDGCGVNTNCISNQRIDVSAAFFIATEFQVTDFYVYRVRKASFGVLPTFNQFTLDRSLIGAGSTAEKKTFTETFVQFGDFLGVYPTNQSGAAFIDKLVATVLAGSGVDLTSRKPDLQLEYLQEATQVSSRARTIRRLVDYPEFVNAEFNRGFVAAEYYGYLRRDPDTAGYNFWLSVLNNNVPGNSRAMVCGFLTSAEYQLRFGPKVTRTNLECATVAP